MRAVVVTDPGEQSRLEIGEVERPSPGEREVRIAVAATAVNRADLLQRRGLYPPPQGASDILGLECSGTIAEVGTGVSQWQPGDRVMALLSGGGYAEEVVVDERSVMPVPDSMSLRDAAAIPEAFLTAFLNIFMLGAAREGETALIHGGASGVGTAAIALCREAGVKTIVTAGSAEKCDRCLEIGAGVAINYKAEDFAQRIADLTVRRGVDLILDHIGAQYLGPNISSLATGGRLLMIGTMGGRSGELDIGRVLARRLHLIGSTLRSRSAVEKGEIVNAFAGRFGDALTTGRIGPVVDRLLPLAEAEQAHRAMAASEHVGKIVLVLEE